MTWFIMEYPTKVLQPQYTNHWGVLTARAINELIREVGIVNFLVVEPVREKSRVINAVKIVYDPVHSDRDEVIRFVCNRFCVPTTMVRNWLGKRPITAELLALIFYTEFWEELKVS